MTARMYIVGRRTEDGALYADYDGELFTREEADADLDLARQQNRHKDWLPLEVREVPGEPVDLPDVLVRIKELAKELGDWADTRILEASAGGDTSVPLLLVRVGAWLDLVGQSYARIQDAGDADVPAELVQVLDAIPAVTG